MQPYVMEVKYRPGADNPADYLSRHPVPHKPSKREETIAEEYIQYIDETSTPKAMSKTEVTSTTISDQTLIAARKGICTGRWYEAKMEAGEIDTKIFNALEQCQTEMLLVRVDNNHIILKGSRIVLPNAQC